MFLAMRNARRLVVYADARHAIGGVASATNGPATGPLLADWVAARFAGQPLASERWFVDAAGRVSVTPLPTG